MPFDRFKGGVADGVLHFAGILGGGGFIHAKLDKPAGKQRVPLIDLFGHGAAGIGQRQGAVPRPR